MVWLYLPWKRDVCVYQNMSIYHLALKEHNSVRIKRDQQTDSSSFSKKGEMQFYRCSLTSCSKLSFPSSVAASYSFTNSHTHEGPEVTWSGCQQHLASQLPPSCFFLLTFLLVFLQSAVTPMPAQIPASSDIHCPKHALLHKRAKGTKSNNGSILILGTTKTACAMT